MKDWNTTKWVIFASPFALVLLALVIMTLFRGSFRSRRHVAARLAADDDIHDWLIVFGWSRKILYMPTVLASILAAAVTWLSPDELTCQITSRAWTVIFLLNFLVDEYELSLRVLMTLTVLVFATVLWLFTLEWVDDALRMIGTLEIRINPLGYIMLAVLVLLTMAISWMRGLFCYTVFTPNYMNLQTGVSETGDQIDREHYNTRVDTGDFLERMLGFGWIVITFSDPHRQPMRLLVGNIGQKAAKLESIRGKIAVDD